MTSVTSAKSRVTLATVARRAGVSITTVSVILAGRPHSLARYNSQTVAKVRQTAEKLQYRANLFATGLPAQKTPFFALVLPDFRNEILGDSHVISYEASLMAGVIWAGTERRLYPVTLTIPRNPDQAGVREALRVIDGGVFGSIARTPNAVFERALLSRLRAGHPMVILFPARTENWLVNSIDVDNVAVGRTAADLLLGRRRTRWTLVHYRKLADADSDRCRGFLGRAAEVGVKVNTIRVPTDTRESELASSLSPQLARLRSDGIFAPESVSSVASVLACRAHGWRAAQDYDLIGVDAAGWRPGGMPSITCVDISWEAVGTRAVQELARMYDSGGRQFARVLLPPRILPGETCPVSSESTIA